MRHGQLRGTKLNILSLFDGLGGARIALDRADIPVDNYFASEIDKYAIKIARKNYPEINHLGDVTELLASHNLPKIDLLIGGSPCQGFSFAGKQLNFDDQRSKLFFEYVKILRELKPRYFLLENVRMRQDSQDAITDLLGVDPIVINSNLVSAQNRHRLYWTNIPVAGQPEDQGLVLADVLENGFVDRDKSHCIDANYFKGGNRKSYFEKHRRQLVFSDAGLNSYRKLTVLECERLQTVPDVYTEGVSNSQRYKMLGNGFTVDVIAFILKGISI